MASVAQADSKRKYSWWWDSHISPKNSKWLQENLTDMDVKVKQMIKLIEEDADSFAKRAEMYYRQRPELMKLVEEFYRAYRALAERYDHATGALRQAHRALAEKEAGLLQYQQSLERLTNLELEVSHAREDSKGLSDQASKAEAEVQTLKVALTRLEAEREVNLLQYQQCLDKISDLEKNISRAETNAGELGERASKAEIEAQSLKQDLSRIEAEKEAALVKYEECLKLISDLEDKLMHAEEDARRINENADKAESEVETLKQALAKLTEGKEALAFQYQQCLETI